MMEPVKLILVGGFLGAGKTTLMLEAAGRLQQSGRRAALIMNDQATDLVDTKLAQSRGLPVAEVAGGCFCCRFPDLDASIDRLVKSAHPDVILAEPVGSCTDLSATVAQPMKDLRAGEIRLAPLSVLVDPARLQGE